MSAETHLQSGNIDLALEDLKNQVRNNPGDMGLRVFLFQLLAAKGDFERAENQMEVAGNLSDEAAPMVQAYKEVINCERHREAVFAGNSKPLIFGEPEEWIALMVEAQQAYAQGNFEAFSELNAKAFEMAEPRSGKINDEPFEWLADADQRFGPMFEAIFNGQYYWVPMSRVKAVRTEEPTDLRDLIWQPAEITWINEGQVMVMMPARYPNMEAASDGEKLSRKTNWLDHGNEIFEGVGQRLLATDSQDYSFLQVRSIEFDD